MSSVFDRLYKTETASSRQKRLLNRKKQQETSTAPFSETLRQSNSRPPKHTVRTPSRQQQQTPTANTVSAGKASATAKLVPKPSQKPVAPQAALQVPSANVNTKLDLSSRDKPEDFRPLLIPRGSSLETAVLDYELGTISAENLASSIITYLFDRDFLGDKTNRWDIDSATVETREANVFEAVKEATYNHKDIYSVASAKAKIHFVNHDGVRIEGKFCYVIMFHCCYGDHLLAKLGVSTLLDTLLGYNYCVAG